MGLQGLLQGYLYLLTLLLNLKPKMQNDFVVWYTIPLFSVKMPLPLIQQGKTYLT
jgi:hypothetical protein